MGIVYRWHRSQGAAEGENDVRTSFTEENHGNQSKGPSQLCLMKWGQGIKDHEQLHLCSDDHWARLGTEDRESWFNPFTQRR